MYILFSWTSFMAGSASDWGLEAVPVLVVYLKWFHGWFRQWLRTGGCEQILVVPVVVVHIVYLNRFHGWLEAVLVVYLHQFHGWFCQWLRTGGCTGTCCLPEPVSWLVVPVTEDWRLYLYLLFTWTGFMAGSASDWGLEAVLVLVVYLNRFHG